MIAPTERAPTARRAVVADRSWWSEVGAHGGYLASVALAASRAALTAQLGSELPVRSLTTYYLKVVDDRPFMLDANVTPAGRSAGAVTITGSRDGTALLAGSAVFGASRSGPREEGHPPPSVPSPDAAESIALRDELAPFARRLEIRAASAARPLASGGDVAELVGWIRFRDDRPLDAEAVTVLTDSLPPGLFARWTDPLPVPTADLTVHFTDALESAAAGWALVRIRTAHAGSGWAIDDSEVWNADGQLLALARQTRRILIPADRAE
ncbi:MAG TPA: thioesterase family protein [Pseudonocardiaceae bacterium]